MGKIDDMRRVREQQFAAAAKPTATAGATKASDGARARADAKPDVAADDADERGRCPDCGKMKPVTNGLVANHQKGFGKACAGSRKKPVA